MDEVRYIAERGAERFEIVEGRGEGYYVFRWIGETSTHDYLQDTSDTAKQCALEMWGVPVEAWREVLPGESTFFAKSFQ